MPSEKIASPAVNWMVSTQTPVERLLAWIDRNMAVVFNIPTVLFLLGLIAFPVVLVLWTSLTDWQLITQNKTQFVGLVNYLSIWQEERWLRGVLNTFYFAIASVLLQLAIGMGTALLFNRNFTGKTFYP